MDNDQAKKHLGKELAYKIIRMPGTIRQVGADLGVSASTVSNVINGYYERLSIRMYMRLAESLQSTVQVEVIHKD